MEKKVSYRFLNTYEGQQEAHAVQKRMREEGLNPTFTMGVKWIIVQTDYIEEENDKTST